MREERDGDRRKIRGKETERKNRRRQKEDKRERD